MGTTGIQIVIILAYISVLFGISWYVKRRAASSTEDYVLAGRRLTTPLIMVSIVGLAVGGASTIGVAEQAYKVGLSAGWYTAAWGIGAIVMGLTVAKKYRRLHITTVPELLERYYDRRSMVAGIACQVLVQLVVMSLQYVAGGAVLAALMPDIFTPVTGMFTSAVVFIGITLIGGMWSASQSNILNVTLQYIGITVAAFLIVAMAGGIDVVAIQAPTVTAMDFFSGVGPMTIVTWIVVLITVNISLQAIIQISLGAKDVQTARKGFVIGGLVCFPSVSSRPCSGSLLRKCILQFPRRRPCRSSSCRSIPGLPESPWPPYGPPMSVRPATCSCRQRRSILTTSTNSSSILRCRIRSTWPSLACRYSC